LRALTGHGHDTKPEAGEEPVLPFEMIALSQAPYYMMKDSKSEVVLGMVKREDAQYPSERFRPRRTSAAGSGWAMDGLAPL